MAVSRAANNLDLGIKILGSRCWPQNVGDPFAIHKSSEDSFMKVRSGNPWSQQEIREPCCGSAEPSQRRGAHCSTERL